MTRHPDDLALDSCADALADLEARTQAAEINNDAHVYSESERALWARITAAFVAGVPMVQFIKRQAS